MPFSSVTVGDPYLTSILAMLFPNKTKPVYKTLIFYIITLFYMEYKQAQEGDTVLDGVQRDAGPQVTRQFAQIYQHQTEYESVQRRDVERSAVAAFRQVCRREQQAGQHSRVHHRHDFLERAIEKAADHDLLDQRWQHH